MDKKTKKKIYAYNTMSHRYERIEVNEDVAVINNRTNWNIKDNDKAFFDHEIQMSGLIGGKNNAFENFREFVSMENETENAVLKKMLVEDLYNALNALDETDCKIIYLLYYDCLSERECAGIIGVSQPMIHKKKKKILKKLKKLLS